MGKFIGTTGLLYLWNKVKNLLATGLSGKADKATTLAGYGITDAINTSSTAQTKAGNLTATKFITNGGSASQFVKGDGSLDSNTYMSQKLLESRGENLIYNGNGFMRDNTNFPSFVFDQTECNGSIGSFKKTGSVQAMCTYSIPVSPSLTYMFRIDGKQSEQTKLFYAMLNCYDIDGYEILPEHYYWKEAEKTELTQDLVAGDTIIHLANISDEWLKTTGGTGSTIINFWNYTNSKGYTFPPYTYTRNSLNYGSYDAIDRATNTITLSVPYSGKTIPVGTKVSRKRYGGTYLYLWSGKFNSDWTTKTSILGEINTSGWADVQNGKHVFRPGTSFVKLGFLVNWSGANTQTTWITNISFSANDAGMSLPLIGGTLTGSIEATSFKKTGGTSSQFLKADGSVDGTSYGTYSKPSGGIPKTDLATAVQTSLGKADTALQSFTETDPTVPAWAKAANKPSYTAAEVGALPDSTTIPSASTATPQMDGTGAAGSASTYAKGDHVHPTDTSREARVTIVSHGTSDTTFALTPNVLHTWGTINSLTLSLASGSSTYVDGYWFKFTAGSSFTALTMPSGVVWAAEPQIEAGKTYEVMIVDGLASYVTDGIGDTVKAKTRIVNHGTSDTTYQLAPNEFHIWGEVASLNLTLKAEANGYVSGYWFRFTCGSTPTTLTLPSSVEWYYENVEFEANHTYEVTIVEGKACYTDYASTTQIATKQWVQNNTKTINGESIIGEGDIVIEGGEGASEIPIVNHGTSDTSISILPNVFHVWGEVPSLTLTLAAGGSGVVNEYMFQFTSGSTPTSLSFSSNVSWITDSTIEANKTYQVSILNNLVVMGGA